MKEGSFILFAGSSHLQFAKEVARSLRMQLGRLHIESFPDREIGVQILENVRGKDVFIFQSAARRPNHFLFELLILIDAFKRASARSIVAVLPYFPYARQDRKEKGRVPITAKLVADLLEKAGATRLLAMDLHTDQIQGFFNIPVDHLQARPLFVKELRRAGLKEGIVVSPDVGGSRRARKFAEDLEMDLAIVDKRRVSAKRVEANALMGNVEGKEVVIVDDICATGKTLEIAAKVCRSRGAKKVFAAVTHPLLTNDALPKGIDEFWVTDSVPLPRLDKRAPLQITSVVPLFGQAIECVAKEKSISPLFKS